MTRLFYTTQNNDHARELFETLEQAIAHLEEIDEDNSGVIEICKVKNAFREGFEQWNYEDYSDTFEIVETMTLDRLDYNHCHLCGSVQSDNYCTNSSCAESEHMWNAYPELGCFYRFDGCELEYIPMNNDGSMGELEESGYVDFELMKGEEIYPRLLEVKIELMERKS